ncbi:YggS family pyridoxal phosphate-dependent enzyme [Paenibacillus tarimensis]
MTLAERIASVEERIRAACERSGRSREEIRIIAVTKYVTAATAKEVLKSGLNHLGENRWQHAEEKWRVISGASGDESKVGSGIGQPVWHFIGTLQTNKVRDVIGKFTYIHSLDRLSLAQAIDKKAAQLGIQVPCFIQVNVSGEDSKHGLPPEQLFRFASELAHLDHIKIEGLMTMAPFASEPELTRPVFRELRRLRDELNGRAILREPATGLSMGMSGDFEIAVEEGANWVRLGTILVGNAERL